MRNAFLNESLYIIYVYNKDRDIAFPLWEPCRIYEEPGLTLPAMLFFFSREEAEAFLEKRTKGLNYPYVVIEDRSVGPGRAAFLRQIYELGVNYIGLNAYFLDGTLYSKMTMPISSFFSGMDTDEDCEYRRAAAIHCGTMMDIKMRKLSNGSSMFPDETISKVTSDFLSSLDHVRTVYVIAKQKDQFYARDVGEDKCLILGFLSLFSAEVYRATHNVPESYQIMEISTEYFLRMSEYVNICFEPDFFSANFLALSPKN